jgi:cephalosporin hydroxylase
MGRPMTAAEEFSAEVRANIQSLKEDEKLRQLSHAWMSSSIANRYTYNFSWMGRPIIQYPQDMVAMQEIIWAVQPDLIVETGIAHGGSLVFYASVLELVGRGSVLGIDVDIRAHNRAAIEAHPMMKRISMIEGSSTDDATAATVVERAEEAERVLVVLDSNHTHEHVLTELRLYAPLVSLDSYCVVMDTLVEDFPEHEYADRPWAVGDNPRTAVDAFLEHNTQFVIDEEIDAKLQISSARSGYLKRIR